MNTTISLPPLPKAVAVPATSLQPQHRDLNLTVKDLHHHNLLLLHPPPKPSSLRRLDGPSSSPLRALEPPSRPIRKDRPPETSLPMEARPRRKNSTTDVLRLMDALSLPVPPETYSSLFKECTLWGDSEEAIELHRHLKHSCRRPSLGLLNRVLLMHVSCGCMAAARRLFDEMPQRDFLSWSVLFAAFMEAADYGEAIRFFLGIRVRFRSAEVPSWMVCCVLKACIYSRNVELGKQVHGWIVKTGASDEKRIPICLINFYGKFSTGNYASTVFHQLPRRNSITWTAKLVSGYRKRRFREVVSDFREMGRTGTRITSDAILSTLKASAGIRDGGDCGKQIHANAIKVGVETREHIQHGLVDMYAKTGLMINARSIYDEMVVANKRSIVCSNAMIKGYLRNGSSVEAIKLLGQMKADGIPCPEGLVDKVRVLSGS